jgi:two-component system chemotaxis response regulator CheY
MEILIVDDEMVSRMLLRTMLEKVPGYSVKDAADGAAAWEMLTGGFTPDLVMVDVVMPRLSGIELLQRMRADERLKNVAAIILTATRDRATIEQATSLGASYYLLKPFTASKVMEQVKRVQDGLVKVSPLKDRKATQQRLEIDDETYYKSIRLLNKEIQEAIEPLKAAVAKAEWTEATTRVNGLYGACMSLDLADLARALVAMEGALRASDANGATAGLKRVDGENQRVAAALPKGDEVTKLQDAAQR